MSEAPPSTPRRGLLLALILVPLVALMAVPMLLLLVLFSSSQSSDSCSPSSPGTWTGGTPPGLSFEIDDEQMGSAVVIVQTGKALGIADQGEVIAVMAALQESSLRNLAHGDLDSLGLFQQRPSQGWGTAEEIMDPVKSSSAFYGVARHTTNPGVVDVANWMTMPPGAVAQAVQGSAFPDAYDKWEPDARIIVDFIIAGGGATTTSTPPGGEHYDIGPVQPQTQVLADTLGHMFGIEDIYGWRASDPYPDHPSGLAADFMVYKDRATGDALAQYAMEHAADLQIDYILWFQRSWTAGDPVGQWKPMEDRGGDTANHKDHVHITTLKTNAPTYGDPVFDIGEVQPLTQHIADTIGQEFDLDSEDMVGRLATDDYPEHPGGIAVDFTVGSDTALGDEIALYAMTNAGTLKVTYIVWRNQAWHIDDPVGVWTPLAGSAEADEHLDSVHITATEATIATSCGATPAGQGGDWVNPLPAGGYSIGSAFGPRTDPFTGETKFHAGQDLPTGSATPPIGAVAGGTVTFAGDCGCGYGNLVTIDVGDGLVMYYGHLSVVAAAAGETVTAGSVIGNVGSTGRSTGNHLHLEFRQDGAPEDPVPVLSAHGVSL